MSDSIDRQKAIDAVNTMPVMVDNNGEEFVNKHFTLTKLSLLQPTQPEIIHCKDCKHSHITTDGKLCKYCDMWEAMEMYVDADFYCGYAERKP